MHPQIDAVDLVAIQPAKLPIGDRVRHLRCLPLPAPPAAPSHKPGHHLANQQRLGYSMNCCQKWVVWRYSRSTGRKLYIPTVAEY